MKIRATLLALVAVVGPFLLISDTSQATSATYSDTGTLSSNGNWANTLTFTNPNVTATFDVTNTDYQAVDSDNTCMSTDSCGWWGVDDVNGFNCGVSVCDSQTSLANSLAAFTPSSVASTEGVTWTWMSSRCGPTNSVYPTPANPNINCPNVSTVKVQFSAPVSNAILHIGNLGGNGNFPARTSGFDKGFDMTLYSKWTLTSGQDIMMLSGENTTNITLDNNIIRNKYIPQGLGARPGLGECVYNSETCRNKNGTGSGSFLILGTYSTITFNIDLGFSLVNYGWNEPTTSALVDSWFLPNGNFIPEGVTVQISFSKYELSYNLNGGTGTTPITVTGLSQGDTTILASDTEFSKTGYTFAGWNCDNAIGAIAAGSTATQPAANVVCTAQWTPVTSFTVTAISENQGSTAGGNTVTITGTGFVAGATVTIGGKACTNVVVVSATSITCVVPAGVVGVVDVVVLNGDNQTQTLAGAYTYVSPAETTSTAVSPPVNSGSTSSAAVTKGAPKPLAANSLPATGAAGTWVLLLSVILMGLGVALRATRVRRIS